MFIDIYTHFFPGEFYAKMTQAAPRLENIGKRMQAVVAIHDLDERFRQMDPFGDYRQMISLPNPPLEEITDPEMGSELARVANDAMADLVLKHPDRFPGFIAALAMHKGFGRARRTDIHQCGRQAARSAAVSALVRRHGGV